MKGISTVIATLMLLIITIALIVLAYSYIIGLFTVTTGKVVTVDSGATFCSGTTITLYIKNTGTTDFSTADVNIQIGGAAAILCDTTGQTVSGGGASVACGNPLAAANGVSAGNNIVIVGSASTAGPSNTVRASVFCPG